MNPSTRALARLARRSIAKAPLRSFLVVIAISIVVAVGTATAVIVRSTTPNADDYRLGTFGQADTLITIHPRIGLQATTAGSDLLDQVSRWIENFQATDGIGRIREVAGSQALVHRYIQALDGTWTDIDMADPLAAGVFELVDGTYPTADGETTVRLQRARSANLGLADTVRSGDRDLVVVGIAEPRSPQTGSMIVTPGVADRAILHPLDFEYRVLLNLARQDRIALVTAIEEIVGFDVGVELVDGSMMFKDQSGNWIIAPSLQHHSFANSSASAWNRVIPVAVTTALGIQIALVASVVFAVGIRRRTREFGQLVATGGDRAQIRRLVLLEAGLLGIVGGVVGLIVGFLSADRLLTIDRVAALGERYALDTRWSVLDLAGPPLIGVLAVLVAAWWPTRLLARAATTASLAGRLPEGRLNPRTPGLGVLLVTVGVLAMRALTEPVIDATGVLVPLLWVGSALVSFLGLLMVIGGLLSAVGRRADRLPLLARLATRNADRHRSRSWVVVAAFIATLAIPILIGASTKAYPGSYDPSGTSAADVRLFALGVSVGLAVLIALIAGSLSAVELDSDVRSMIASGAEPSMRRKLLGVQTWYYLVMAAVLSVPFSLLVFNVVARMDDHGPTSIVIPWGAVAAVVVIVPVAVAALIGVLFRNGTPAVSRRLS